MSHLLKSDTVVIGFNSDFALNRAVGLCLDI